MAECQWPEVGPASGGPETPRLGQLKIIPCLTPPLAHYDRTSLVGEIPGPPLASISQRHAQRSAGIQPDPRALCYSVSCGGQTADNRIVALSQKQNLGFTHQPAPTHLQHPYEKRPKIVPRGAVEPPSACAEVAHLSAFNTQVDFDSTARSPSSRTWQRRHISRPLRASARVLCRSAAVPVRSAASALRSAPWPDGLSSPHIYASTALFCHLGEDDARKRLCAP